MFLLRRKSQKDYIEYFMRDPEHVPYPNVVNLETINRCNSNCAFCTANIYAEKRPYMYMTDEMFHKIIDELADFFKVQEVLAYLPGHDHRRSPVHLPDVRFQAVC